MSVGEAAADGSLPAWQADAPPAAPQEGVDYQLPTRARRITVAALMAVALFVVFVLLPYVLLAETSQFGASFGLSSYLIYVFGSVLALLTPLVYLAKPTTNYGPIFAGKCLVVLAYLAVLWHAAYLSFAPPSSGVTATIGWEALIPLIAIIPAIKFFSALVITVEDRRFPGERLRYDYPLKRSAVPGG